MPPEAPDSAQTAPWQYMTLTLFTASPNNNSMPAANKLRFGIIYGK